MKTLVLFLLLSVFPFAPLAAQNDLTNLEKAAKSFVEAFNDGDPEAIAALFIPNGELILASGEILMGRQSLIDHYTEVFAKEDRARAALEASSVRFIAADLATEDGSIHLTYPNGEITSHHFTSVHAKQEDGSWLYASVRDLEGDHALPSEKLLALQWLIGDWVIQTEHGDTWLSFDWSNDGPYIDAKTLTQAAGIKSTAATLRIGWNERSKVFNSWAFDDNGGFNHSSWNAAGPDRWILKTNGVTAGGETNNATQTFELDASRESFIWSKRDQIIGGVVQPNRSLRAVKRPPLPASDSTESR